MKYIIANWKMNISSEAEALSLLSGIESNVLDIKDKEVVLCPSFTHLSIIKKNIRKFKIGSQSVSTKVKGNYTGEVGISQLLSLGVEYCILGHSETIENRHETSEEIKEKIILCKNNNIFPVVCVGSGLKSSDSDSTIKAVLRKQINNIFYGLSLKNLFIVYEPVWAIATGISPDKNHLSEINKFISSLFDSENFESLKILYGGSVNSMNIESFSDYDGVLVGTASLDALEFSEIIKNI